MQVAARHAPARARDLGDHGRAVLADLADREAEPRQVRHVLEAGIGEVAAGDLAGALEQVADERSPAEPRPVVHRPAELVDERGEEERRVGHAAGDHDVGALRQGLDDRRGAEVGVGRDERSPRAATVRRSPRARSSPRRSSSSTSSPVTAATAGRAARARARSPDDRPRAAERIGGAHVGEDRDAARAAGRQHGPHPLLRAAGRSPRRVPALLLLGERDRPLGQALEDQVVEPALLRQLDRRLDAVARSSRRRAPIRCLMRFLGVTAGDAERDAGERHQDRGAPQERDRELLVLRQVDARQADEQERRRRQRAHREAGRHLAEQRALRDLDRRDAQQLARLRDDRQHAEVERVRVEEQAQRHRDEAEDERDVARQPGGHVADRGLAIAASMPEPA